MSINKKIFDPRVLAILAIHTGICYYFQWPVAGALGAGLIIGGHLGVMVGIGLALHKFHKVLPPEFIHAVMDSGANVEIKVRQVSKEDEAEFDNLIKQAEHELNKKD